MSGFLLILQFILALMITIAVLMQKSSSIGLGAYSGSNESLFGAKGPAGFLAKLTFGLGFLFVINTIALGHLYMKDSKSSLLDNVKLEQNAPLILNPAENPISVPDAPPAPLSPQNAESTPKGE